MNWKANVSSLAVESWGREIWRFGQNFLFLIFSLQIFASPVACVAQAHNTQKQTPEVSPSGGLGSLAFAVRASVLRCGFVFLFE